MMADKTSQTKDTKMENKLYSMHVKVEVKNHYGNDNIYVVSEQAEAIKKLTGRKTVTQSDISALKELGFTFGIQQATINI